MRYRIPNPGNAGTAGRVPDDLRYSVGITIITIIITPSIASSMMTMMMVVVVMIVSGN